MYAASHENARRRAFYHQQQRNKKRANDLAVYLAERQRRQPVDVELDRETARRDLLDHGIEDVLGQ